MFNANSPTLVLHDAVVRVKVADQWYTVAHSDCLATDVNQAWLDGTKGMFHFIPDPDHMENDSRPWGDGLFMTDGEIVGPLRSIQMVEQSDHRYRQWRSFSSAAHEPE